MKRIIISIDSLRFHVIDLQSIYILTPLYESEVWGFLKLKRDEIFIDVEGAELEVVKGLRRTLDRFRPQIIIKARDRIESKHALILSASFRTATTNETRTIKTKILSNQDINQTG
ncbi:hypothetical protein DRN63_04760, partial [Nanoarchaeota archaeon]